MCVVSQLVAILSPLKHADARQVHVPGDSGLPHQGPVRARADVRHLAGRQGMQCLQACSPAARQSGGPPWAWGKLPAWALA